MATTEARIGRRRRWADVVVIFAGVYTLMFAVYAPELATRQTGAVDPGAQGLWWALHYVAGLMALASMLVAFRSVTAARMMVAVAGAVLLSAVSLFRDWTLVLILVVVVPGALLLLVSPFVGRMPRPPQ